MRVPARKQLSPQLLQVMLGVMCCRHIAIGLAGVKQLGWYILVYYISVYYTLPSAYIDVFVDFAGAQKEEPKATPAGAFNPYGVKDDDMIKGGKRSSVNPRSGNRSQSFAG